MTPPCEKKKVETQYPYYNTVPSNRAFTLSCFLLVDIFPTSKVIHNKRLQEANVIQWATVPVSSITGAYIPSMYFLIILNICIQHLNVYPILQRLIRNSF